MFTWKFTAQRIRDGGFLNFFEEVLVDAMQHDGVQFLYSDAVLDQEAGQSSSVDEFDAGVDSLGFQ